MTRAASDLVAERRGAGTARARVADGRRLAHVVHVDASGRRTDARGRARGRGPAMTYSPRQLSSAAGRRPPAAAPGPAGRATLRRPPAAPPPPPSRRARRRARAARATPPRWPRRPPAATGRRRATPARRVRRASVSAARSHRRAESTKGRDGAVVPRTAAGSGRAPAPPQNGPSPASLSAQKLITREQDAHRAAADEAAPQARRLAALSAEVAAPVEQRRLEQVHRVGQHHRGHGADTPVEHHGEQPGDGERAVGEADLPLEEVGRLAGRVEPLGVVLPQQDVAHPAQQPDHDGEQQGDHVIASLGRCSSVVERRGRSPRPPAT